MLSVTIASGSTVSSAFTLERTGSLPLCIFVPSASANGWRVDFTTSSGGSNFLPAYSRTSGLSTVFSGSAGAVVVIDYPPSPWVRIATIAAVTDTATVALTTTRRSQ